MPNIMVFELHKDGRVRRYVVEPHISRRGGIRRKLADGWEPTDETRAAFVEYMELEPKGHRSDPAANGMMKQHYDFKTERPASKVSARVWYAIPSATEELAGNCLAAWRTMGYRTAVFIDSDLDIDADIVLKSKTYNGYPDAVNRLCKRIGRQADIVVTGGDDV